VLGGDGCFDFVRSMVSFRAEYPHKPAGSPAQRILLPVVAQRKKKALVIISPLRFQALMASCRGDGAIC